MFASNPLTTARPPYSVDLSSMSSAAEQNTAASLLHRLPTECINGIQLNHADTNTDTAQPLISIKKMVDGRGLACPMPLLKTKVALREVANGESLYVVATDPNSQADITAFCRQAGQTGAANRLQLTVNQMTDSQGTQQADNLPAQSADTIFHFIITKTDSN